MVYKDIIELAIAEGFVPPQYTEAELEEMDQLDEETAILALKDLSRRKRVTQLGKVLSTLKPEEVVSSLNLEERQTLLKVLLEQEQPEEKNNPD